MSYIGRLQTKLALTSPAGLVFEAKWIGDERSLEKRLGIFKTPGVSGVTVQDLATEGVVYPLTFFFDGPDNDLESDRFFKACQETGRWTVVHPVHGEKKLQLVSVTEDVQPVTSGGVTAFETEWLEVKLSTDIKTSAGVKDPALQSVKSAPQLGSETVSQSTDLKVEAAEQFDSVVELDTADKSGKLKVATGETVGAFTNTLENLTATVAEVQAQVDSIKRGIDATIFGPLTDVLALAGQIQALIATPEQIVTDLKTKLETYGRFKDAIFDNSPETSTPANVNTVAMQELALTAALGAVAVSSVTAELESRQDSIDGIESNLAYFDSMTDGLDQIQELYADQLLINSYFSQSQSYADAALLNALTVAFLLSSSFDLAVEKRIVLSKAENPVMIAMREYNGPGAADANIDLFYDSNNLTGQETFLLPAGKEIVVYLGGR